MKGGDIMFFIFFRSDGSKLAITVLKYNILLRNIMLLIN